ncbi:DUF4810 domain-containing protein [Porphyromonas sp.]|uniref:DUF4810 domain-containing protein n=1 Tax=Porphyromonas sp. TaxID=1924944 RepID=UPI0026DDA73C|nr:DUF4810 domain-containing protein [Porphyromonas sp.]MDO4695206.1 DUF4810 domain-containing protein [Porphyromonas sp.]MDO4770994.1 DUF4810 domain-containing protein [Porphyromonas sp.]
MRSTKLSYKLTLTIMCVLTYFFQGCGTTYQALYSWQGYEDLVIDSMSPDYQGNKKNINRYKALISNQSGFRRTPPPGILLEYGCELAMSGAVDEGIKMMELEIANYPESKVFVTAIIEKFKK